MAPSQAILACSFGCSLLVLAVLTLVSLVQG